MCHFKIGQKVKFLSFIFHLPVDRIARLDFILLEVT